MARFMRLEVINTLLDTGVVPLFYNGDIETAIELVAACAGGARLIEFTNRGELAYPVFTELVRHFDQSRSCCDSRHRLDHRCAHRGALPGAGANFIVGPSFNPEIARLCNRRKILYMPGCATETEISTAEEYGAEICKISPANRRRAGIYQGGHGTLPLAPPDAHRRRGCDRSQHQRMDQGRRGRGRVGQQADLRQASRIKTIDGIADQDGAMHRLGQGSPRGQEIIATERTKGDDTMKYHALLTANQGLNTLPINPCKLLDFGLLKLAAGESYSAEDAGAKSWQ